MTVATGTSLVITATIAIARVVAVAALALGGLVLAVALGQLLSARSPRMGPILRAELIGVGGALLLMPMSAAVFAALHTATYTATETYQLMRLTSLPPLSLVRLLVALVLARLRLLLVLSAALIPGFAVAVMHRTVHNTMLRYPGSPILGHWLALPPPRFGRPLWRFDMLGLTPEFFGWAVALWGLVPLAAALGVGLTLRWRRVAIAAPVAAVITLLVPAGLLLPIVLLPLEDWGEPARAAVLVALALAPNLLTVLAMRVARRWV